MSLHAWKVSWSVGGSVGGTVVVDDITLQVPPGSMLGLLGPNGSGKSSLLRLLAGLRKPSAGVVLLDGTDLADWRRRELARRIAMVEQEVSTEVDLTVAEVVALGRTPYRGRVVRGVWSGVRCDDQAAVERALEQTGLAHLAHRRWHSLSGGERQRTQIARALAQTPTELLLDEPTNHLDIAHQLDLLALVRQLPVTSVLALHDLNLAAAFCDSLLVLSSGKVVAAGAPAEVLTEDLVRRVYGVNCVITHDPDTHPHMRFLAPGAEPAGRVSASSDDAETEAGTAMMSETATKTATPRRQR